MKYTIDGDQICVTTDHFTNLQESRSAWLAVDSELGEKLVDRGVDGLSMDERVSLYMSMIAGGDELNCPDWGKQSDGHFGRCRSCEVCEIVDWI